MSDLTHQLQKAREAKKLSQRKLSESLGMPQSYLSKVESGNTDIRLSSLEQIAQGLGLDIMLIPKAYVPAVNAIIKNETKTMPMWQPDEDVEDE